MKKQSNARRIVSIYWQHALKYKKQLAIIYPSMVIAQVIEDFLQPLLVSFILTKLATGDIQGLRHLNLGLIISVVIGTEVIGHFTWIKVVIPRFWAMEEAVMRDLNMTAFDHLQKMSARFYGDRFAGSLVSQVSKFARSFEQLTDALTWNVFKLLVSITATCIILAPKAPLVVVAIIVISIVYTPLVWIFRKKLVPYNARHAAAHTALSGQLSDSFSNIMAVKSFATEKSERNLMLKKANDIYDRSIENMHVTMNQELVTGLVQRSIMISVVLISLYLALNGKANVGVIYLALTFTMQIMQRLWDLNNTFRTITRVFGDANDMSEILVIQPEIKDKPNAVALKVASANIAFNGVTFTHEEGKKALFENLQLNIAAGEKIGLVGHSGGGKTTVTKLLMRFMDIQGGTIEIDGQNIADVTQADLRRHISYVPQEPMLFHRSLAENIAYGKPNASQAEIEKVAKLSHAHEFIQDIPTGYKTLVGERGVKLSGGQRQRIAIARAMIKDAPILVLDEATSALDSESEALIQDALWKLMEGKTAIVIAHRLSTIQKMDRIVVLSEGTIVETGTHADLIKRKGTYAELWAHQTGGFIEE